MKPSNNKIIDWLLEEDNPSIRFRTLIELLDYDADEPAAKMARENIPNSPDVKRIFSRMHPDGYWLQKNSRTDRVVGDGVEYGSFASTHFCLAYLAELGLDRSSPAIEKAANRYLNLQKEDGDFWLHMSCLLAYNIRTFIKLGFRDDPRLQNSIDLLLKTDRPDGGYLCDMHEGKYKKRFVKSCVRGCTKALLAYAELPDYWDFPRCRALVRYFIKRHGLYKSTDFDTPIHFDVIRTSFPITWGASLVEILYGLSKMGYGALPELDSAWQVLASKKNDSGRYILDYTPSYSLLKAGARGEPNKWVTLYALLALKYK